MDVARPGSVARNKKIKRIVIATLVLVAAAGVTLGLSKMKPAAPSVDRGTVWIDTVKRGELLMQGFDPNEIEKRIDEEYRTGGLHAPQRTGIVYMLATDEVWHDRSSNNIARHVYPHIMVYAPYLRNSDIAVAPEQVWRADRVWVQYEGRPDAYLIFEVGSAWTKP